MDRAAVLSRRPAKPSPGARRLARQLADIITPRAIVFEKTPENTLKAAYVEVPLKPGQLSSPKNMFSALCKGGGEETVSSDDDDGESAAGDEAPSAEGGDGDDGESAAAEGDDDDDKAGAA